MANMSYCKFRNTLIDLQDCLNDLDERGGLTGDNEYGEKLEGAELAAAKNLIELCVNIADDYGATI